MPKCPAVDLSRQSDVGEQRIKAFAHLFKCEQRLITRMRRLDPKSFTFRYPCEQKVEVCVVLHDQQAAFSKVHDVAPLHYWVAPQSLRSQQPAPTWHPGRREHAGGSLSVNGR